MGTHSTHSTCWVLADWNNVHQTRPRDSECQKTEYNYISYLGMPVALSSHSDKTFRSPALLIPCPSIGTATGLTLYGAIDAMADGYVHSDTRTPSPGLQNVCTHLYHLPTVGERQSAISTEASFDTIARTHQCCQRVSMSHCLHRPACIL